jgi:hypothetical protein
MIAKYPLQMPHYATPETLISGFHIEVEDESGKTTVIFNENNNYQRLFRLQHPIDSKRVRLCIDAVRSGGKKRIFSFEVY